MRFLIDECPASRVAALRIAAGHDAVHVGELGLLGASDDMVMSAAVSDGRVLVSADTDFDTLLARSGATQPSVNLFRREDRRAEVHAALVTEAITALLPLEIESGFIAVSRATWLARFERIVELSSPSRIRHPSTQARTSLRWAWLWRVARRVRRGSR